MGHLAASEVFLVPFVFLLSGAPIVMLIFVILTYRKVVKLESMLNEIGERFGGTRSKPG